VELFMTVRIKMCCIMNDRESQIAIAAGATALGFVSEMPSGPGVIDETTIAEIVATVPSVIATFLLTAKQDIDAIADQQNRTGVNTIQLCDSLPVGSHEKLRRALPGISIVQVIHVTSEKSVAEALSIAPAVDGLLLDSGRPEATVRELGGTGRIHDWEISRRIRNAAPVPVYLAGGLNTENVEAAIKQVRPFGVDLCSGIRREGALIEDLAHGFTNAVRQAADALPQ
jgi:phosphoribosylanthranilate isomerase